MTTSIAVSALSNPAFAQTPSTPRRTGSGPFSEPMRQVSYPPCHLSLGRAAVLQDSDPGNRVEMACQAGEITREPKDPARGGVGLSRL